MAAIVATNLDVILAAIQARIIDWLDWPDERVIVDARADAHHDQTGPTQAEQYVRLQVKARTPDQPSYQGRGRIYPKIFAAITCILRTRVNLDPSQSDQIALTLAATDDDPARGHLPVEHQVWDALVGFYPEDADGNWLLSEPIEPRTGSAPLKPPKEWMQSVLDFNISFLLALDQSYL